MIAALFVAVGGAYYGLPDVDPWGLPERDARLYAGPYPVICHPPCERWGHLFHACVPEGHPRRRQKGDDGGCFASALASVRRWGGVLEHPAASSAWRHFGLMAPPASGGWISSGMSDGGWTCHIEQGHYGHRAPKATWLYAVGCDLPSLRWGRSNATMCVTTSRRLRGKVPEIPKRERAATPLPFRDLLLSIARSARREAA